MSEPLSDNLFGKQRAKKAALKSGKSKKEAIKIGNATRKKGAKKFVKNVIKTIGNVALTPILPFKPAMKKILAKKGVNVKSMDNTTLIEKFFNEVIAKNKSNGYDSLEEGTLVNDRLFTIPATDENIAQIDEFDPATITMIVTAVVSYFKKAKAKKKAAKNPKTELTNEENIAANQMEIVEKDLNEKAKQDEGVTNKQMKDYTKYIVIAAVLAFAVWFFFIRKH